MWTKSCWLSRAKERRKSRTSVVNKICERCFWCRSIVFCKLCHKCPTCCNTSTCRGQISSVLGKMGSPRHQPQSCNSPQGRLHPTLPVLAKFDPVTKGHKLLCRSPQELEALHQLMDKNAVESVVNQTSLGFYNRLFLVPNATTVGDLSWIWAIGTNF